MMPTVSIIIPNKDRCGELVHTLESVRAQTEPRWECIVIDDNSTDDFEGAVAPFRMDGRFQFIRQSPTRSGAPAARNDGAATAAGEYVIFLDSDDLLAPFCLSQRLAIMQRRPDLDFAVFQCEMFRKTVGDVGLMWNADTGENDLDRFIRHDVPWQTTGPIWRKTALAKVGPWDESARSAQDWEFHLRAVMRGLKYDRFGPIDFYWRMAAADRKSIGKFAAMDKDYHRSRIELYRRIYRAVTDAGQVNDFRRRCFAGMYFTAAELVARKVHRADGRRLWRAALEDGLVTRHEHRQGWWLLLNMRWPARYDRIRAKLQLRWPAEYFLPRSSTFMKTPVPRGAAVAEVA